MLLEAEKTSSTASSSPTLQPACRIIGVLDNGAASLGEQALQYIRDADMVIGAKKQLALFAPLYKSASEQRDLVGKLAQVADWVREAQAQQKTCVILASGDPLCHGIAAYLQSRLCIEACEIIPNVSTIQLACARLGLAWQDIKICSLHKSDVGEWHSEAGKQHPMYPLLHSLQQYERIAVLTSPDNGPDKIARMMLNENLEQHFQLAVVERLHSEDEKVRGSFCASEAVNLRFADPNVVILWRIKPIVGSTLFGLSDDSFKQRKPDKGLITKREIRAISLSRMQLHSDAIVWDIGAGSGSVGLEAARLARDGFVYAIEKNQADYNIAVENKLALGVHNYHLLHNKAPQGMENWPDPDAVFIGGSGGELAQLIELCLQRLRPSGVLVMNFVTLENLQQASDSVKHLQHVLSRDGVEIAWDLCQFQVSRSRPILDMHRMAAENPVWIMSVEKLPASATEKPIEPSSRKDS